VWLYDKGADLLNLRLLFFFKMGIVFRTVLLYTGIVQDTVGGIYEFTIQKRNP
jgi:hypothetical protein